MPRPRPLISLGSAELVKELFAAAFASDATKFEDLLFEIEGSGEDAWGGRPGLSFIKAPLCDAARRVFDTET